MVDGGDSGALTLDRSIADCMVSLGFSLRSLLRRLQDNPMLWLILEACSFNVVFWWLIADRSLDEVVSFHSYYCMRSDLVRPRSRTAA